MATAASPMTLTRRGRLLFRGLPVLAAFAVALMLAMYLMAANNNQAQAAGSLQSVTTKEVTVYAGDTLWDIAAQERPDQDVSLTMMQIEELNDLSQGQLQPGQTLNVPTR